MTDANGRQVLRSDAERNRVKLLEAAYEIISEKGLSFSVDEIARRAGVGMGTLYRRFPTKDALISELLRQLLVEIEGLAAAAQAVPQGMGLERFMYSVGELMSLHNRYFLLAETHGDEELRGIVLTTRDRVGTLLKAAQKNGRIRADIGLSDIDLALWAMRGLMETTKDLQVTAWRRFTAIMVSGMRPSAEAVIEAPITEKQVLRVLSSAVRS